MDIKNTFFNEIDNMHIESFFDDSAMMRDLMKANFRPHIERVYEEIAALKAEIAELKTPDFFFNEDYDCGGGDMLAATHIMNLHQVCRISKMKKLSEHFVVNKYDQDEEEFNTQPEAEAFAASLKGER